MPSLIVTRDGSHSLLNEELNETYHSTHGAIQESRYVFIDMGLRAFAGVSRKRIRVLEVGFGTGLNALLAFGFSESTGNQLSYSTLEAYPLNSEIWRKLNYVESLGMDGIFETLHTTSWNEDHILSQGFTFRKSDRKIQQHNFESSSFDVVFFDAFAPSKQPDMWTMEILKKVCDAIAPQGIFVTYCAKGQLKRDLRSLGMEVETLPGPPGKKEMVRAFRRSLLV